MATDHQNENFREKLGKTEIKSELLKKLIERVDPNFVQLVAGESHGHAKA